MSSLLRFCSLLTLTACLLAAPCSVRPVFADDENAPSAESPQEPATEEPATGQIHPADLPPTLELSPALPETDARPADPLRLTDAPPADLPPGELFDQPTPKTDGQTTPPNKTAQKKNRPAKKKSPKKKAAENKPPQKKPAQPDKRRLTLLDRAAAGIDYNLQGEYGGFLYTASPRGREIGLQVVAQGGGKFVAAFYDGGLPGAAWSGAPPVQLSGAAVKNVLTLKGGGWTIRIDAARGAITNAFGEKLGWLMKVRRISRTMGAASPAAAVVLFNGVETDEMVGGKLTPEGFLLAGVTTKRNVGSFHMHLEFRTPFMPYARGQARGNSGVYIQRRYELQVLDSFGLKAVANGCGGLYKQRAADLNMCLPPLNWQTYDIYFTAAKFDAAANKVCSARITAFHNGVAIHQDRQITAKTGGGKQEGPELLPIYLQDHGNPIYYRNIWLEPLSDSACRDYARRRRCW